LFQQKTKWTAFRGVIKIKKLEMSKGIAENEYLKFVNQTINTNPELSRHFSGGFHPRKLKTDKNRMVCNIILYLLSTGARLNEALQARWDHISLERRVWRIPATNSKSGKVRAVPLNDSAIDVLNEVSTKDKSEWVFPSKRNHGQPFVSLQRVWSRLRKSAQLEHVRIHDLRHQYASFLVNNGASLYTTGQILGHSTPKVTQRYAHLSTATLQDAAAIAADQIKKMQ
jgi:integrase